MSTSIYTKHNYRRNLELYWKQFSPTYTIPLGYHVHHIKPKCTFADKNDPRINHPRNLIALHPDDHVAIHRLRGDKTVTDRLLTSVSGRVVSDATKRILSEQRLGINLTADHCNNISKSLTGRTLSRSHIENLKTSMSDEHRIAISNRNSGSGNPRYGVPVTQETRDKISKKLSGRTYTMSEKRKKKLSLGKLGKKYYNNGIVVKMFVEGEQPPNFTLGRKL